MLINAYKCKVSKFNILSFLKLQQEKNLINLIKFSWFSNGDKMEI